MVVNRQRNESSEKAESSSRFADEEVEDGVEDMHGTDTDAMTVHRRKMQRRAANRRSAQLSRARKKNHMEDLQNENAQLHRMLDIVDSQPDYMFTCTEDGEITFCSGKLTRSALAHGSIGKFNDSGCSTTSESAAEMTTMTAETGASVVTNVSQIIRPESLPVLYGAIAAIKHTLGDDVGDETPKEVLLQEMGPQEQPLLGSLRVSRLKRNSLPRVSDGIESGSTYESTGFKSERPSTKRKRGSANADGSGCNGRFPYISAKSLEDAAAVLSALTGLSQPVSNSNSGDDSGSTGGNAQQQSSACSSLTGNTRETRSSDSSWVRSTRQSSSSTSGSVDDASESRQALYSTNSNQSQTHAKTSTSTQNGRNGQNDTGEFHDGADDEYVCVIRPAGGSLYKYRALNLFSSALSKAAVGQHDQHQQQQQQVVKNERRNSTSGSDEGSSNAPQSSHASSLSKSGSANTSANGGSGSGSSSDAPEASGSDDNEQ